MFLKATGIILRHSLAAAALRFRTGFMMLMTPLGCRDGWSQYDVFSTLAM